MLKPLLFSVLVLATPSVFAKDVLIKFIEPSFGCWNHAISLKAEEAFPESVPRVYAWVSGFMDYRDCLNMKGELQHLSSLRDGYLLVQRSIRTFPKMVCIRGSRGGCHEWAERMHNVYTLRFENGMILHSQALNKEDTGF